MTCVAAIAQDGVVTMAADTETNYQGTRVAGARKVRRLVLDGVPLLVAGSGHGGIVSVSARALTEWHDSVGAAPPKPDHHPNDWQSWCDDAARAITDACAAATPPVLDDDGSLDGAVLLGFSGALVYVFAHQANIVARQPEPGDVAIAALGSGTDHAIGYMTALLSHTSYTPEWIATGAVVVAARYAPGVSATVLVEQVP